MPRVYPSTLPASISNQIQQLANGSTTGVIVNPALDSSGNPAELGFFGATPAVQPTGLASTGGVGTLNTYLPVLSPSAVAANTTAEQTFTVTGLVGTTSLAVVNKPTAQAGLGIAGVRVSAANTLAITFSNDTSGSITPTASETYEVTELVSGDSLTFTAVLSPAAIAANTSAEQTFTVPLGDVAVGSVLAVNKPTAQAGLGIGGVRVISPTQVGITFFNDTATAITPTAAETYLFADIAGLGAANNVMVFTVNVGTLVGVATITTAEQIVAVPGLLATDIIMGVSKPTEQAGLGIAGYRVSSAGHVGITFVNPTVSSITPTANELYSVSVFRGTPTAPAAAYSAALAPASVAANTTAEQTFTVTGLVSATPVAISKPSSQAGLAIVGVRVSAANTLAITYQNNTAAAITPFAETYAVVNFAAGSGAELSVPVSNQSNVADVLLGALISLGLIS
jgi:hypothetical protein